MVTSGNGLEFRYSPHFSKQLDARNFNDQFALNLFREADDHFYDSVKGTYAAVKAMYHAGAVRDIALVYRFTADGSILLITIHPLKAGQKERRIRNGRWQR